MFAASKTAGAVSAEVNYIEDVYSTFLYTGNSSTQTITNGIDLAGEGGLVWIKNRTGAISHALIDTARGGSQVLSSDTTSAQANYSPQGISAFNSSGFTVNGAATTINSSSYTYASWTFRKQPKFFDVVTWSGTGMSVAHSLGTTPATIILKRTNAVDDWYVVHRSANGFFSLNTTNAASGTSNAGIGTDTNTAWVAATSTTCNFENFGNAAGTYVAYLFAHNAGGFGLTGTDNVISCGSWTGTGSNLAVNLGYEPQWLMFKRTDDVGDWVIVDNMRGFTTTGADAYLKPNTSGAETSVTGAPAVNATGFSWTTGAGTNFIYIAIRRGPMKVPTSGTSVFSPISSSSGTGTKLTTGFPVDLQIESIRGGNPTNSTVIDRLRGTSTTTTETSGQYLVTSATDAENTANTNRARGWDNTGFQMPSGFASAGAIFWNFQRAPSFFDEVCYTGTGSNITLNHNLGAIPELMIFKTRTGAARAWGVYSSAFGVNKKLLLNTTAAVANDSFFVDTTPTSTVFYPGNADESNEGGNTYVAYLFATCAGVSKVGSYTGTGTTQQINCGFTGGARFVLLKATSTTGNWMVYDTARGMTTLTDPFLSLNSTSAETATLGACTTVSTGFAVNESILAGVNTNGVSFVYLAIA